MNKNANHLGLKANDQVNNNSLESEAEKKRLIVKATHEYIPVNNDELRIRPGDIITITNPEEGGWWEGTLDTRTGWFPSNYVTVVDSSDKISNNLIANSNEAIPQLDEYKRIIVGELLQSEEAFLLEVEGFYTDVLLNISPHQNHPRDAETVKQLKQTYSSIIATHKAHLLQPLKSQQTVGSPQLRVGKLFLTAASHLEQSHTQYCSLHPRFVQFVERNREGFGEVLRVITLLSAPFRRVERYGALLNELDCHVEAFHGDKGDLQRGVGYYRGLEKKLTDLRKQKEMELEVLTPGQIKEWEGSDIASLGEILLMDLMWVGAGKERVARYFVLFPTTIVLLAYGEDNCFWYKGRVHVGGVTVVGGCRQGKEEDGEDVCFEIAGPTLHPIQITCPSSSVKRKWLHKLSEVIRATRCYSTPTMIGQQQHPHNSNNNITPPPRTTPTSFNIGATPLTPPIQAWNITRLRPSPPYNPFLAEYRNPPQKLDRGGIGRSSASSLRGSGGNSSSSNLLGVGGKSTGSFSGFSNSSSSVASNVTNEDDFAVLSIVDGFCVRNAGGAVLLRNDSSKAKASAAGIRERHKSANPVGPGGGLAKTQQQKKQKYSWCCGGMSGGGGVGSDWDFVVGGSSSGDGAKGEE